MRRGQLDGARRLLPQEDFCQGVLRILLRDDADLAVGADGAKIVVSVRSNTEEVKSGIRAVFCARILLPTKSI